MHLVQKLLCLTLSSCFVLSIFAQTNSQQKPQDADAGIVGENIEEADQPVAKPASKADADTAWQMIETGLGDPKEQTHIDALNALGTLGGNKHAETLLLDAFKDKNVDVRVAAIAACGAMGDPNMLPALRQALDDPAPEAAFAAAVSLWKLHDQAGVNVLYEVLAGERKTQGSFLQTGQRQASKDLHDPTTLAKIGAQQGAYALLGPFGIGLDAARLMTKSNHANSARVLTATLLSEDHSQQTKQEFIAALGDKDYFVRAASARALGSFSGKDVTDALTSAWGDSKPAVRFMAAAAYIRITQTPVKRPSRRR